MKKFIMLGVNTKSNCCCKLSCPIPFENLVASELEANDFVHGSTNWDGRDEIERTLDIIKMKQTGKKIILDKPLVFTGVDSDCGHSYSWNFEVNEIHELVEKDVVMDYKEHVINIQNKTNEFLNYVSSTGNECAYSDRIVEEILAAAEELERAYNA